jgi:hypothetical protein
MESLPNLIVISSRYKILFVSSLDSDLEAFSHNPADDSFTSLSVQTNVKTKYLNQWFLSY